MIDAHIDPATRTGSIVLAPNCSLSWPRTKVFLAGTTVFVLGLAGSLTVIGWWPVLLVALLEMAGLWVASYAVARHQQSRELLAFTDEEIIVQSGRHRPEREVRYPRHWTQLVVREGSPGQWYLRRLFLRCYGRETELARYLGDEERASLVRQLRSMLHA
ncbi:MAG: DUF2244 domain-containing protein [Gammaproteobacteria bacterium]|nr:DUF2244 domain-containing protein [Gammaproteobacteria bacterium]